MNTARLFDAAISGNIDSFIEKIGGGVLSLEQVTPRGNSILHVAAKSGKVEIMIKVLDSLSQQSPLNVSNCKGNTALHITASLGHFDLAELLITRASRDQEADVKQLLLRAQNVEKNTALHLAAKHGHYDIVELLIKEDPGLTSVTNDARESPLFLAVDRGLFEIALHILEIPKCSEEGRNNMNVLHAAIIRAEIKSRFKDERHNIQTRSNKPDITRADFVRKISEKFPNAILKADDFGWTPLHYAAYFGSLEVVKLFLENNNISLACERDKQGMSALHISAKKGHHDVMRAIIEKFPYTCELLDNRGRTALHHAVESGSTAAVNKLLSSLAFQDLINEQENDEGNTAMHLAAIKRRYEVLILLASNRNVEKGATNKEGKTTADIIQLDKQLMRSEKEELMSKWCNGGEGLLSLEREVEVEVERQTTGVEVERQTTEIEAERQTTEVSIPVSDGHVQNQDSKTETTETTEPAAKDPDLKEMNEYRVLVTTLITTVTFAAAFQVPGGYDGNGKANLQKNQQFRYFLIFDSLAFTTSTASLLIHSAFKVPFIQSTFAKCKILRLESIFSTFSLYSLLVAFMSGIEAVLDKKSSFYNIARVAIALGWATPILLFGTVTFNFLSSRLNKKTTSDTI
nr:ankyrin repeat-containing protein ITN1-like [Quercus suber]